MIISTKNLGELTKIRTGKLDANASSEDGQYPFFTCARDPLRIGSYSYDCECVLVAGNGDLNVKYYEGKFDAYQRTYIVETRPESKDALHLRYAYHFLETYLETLREQSIGGIIKYIKLGNLTEAAIPLPPLAEQKQIAEILDAADALRSKRRESLAQLDTLLQSTFIDMFGDPVTNPKGWEEGTIGDLLESVNYGTSKKADLEEGAYPILRMNNITYTGEWDFSSMKYIDLDDKDLSKHLVHKGHILFNRTNSKELVGKTAVFRRDAPMVFAGYLVRGITNDFADPEYIGAFMNTPQIKQFLQNKCKSIVGMANINAKEFQAIPIPKPPIALQRRFAAIVESVEQQKARMRAHLAELDTLFASLQQRAFNGELST